MARLSRSGAWLVALALVSFLLAAPAGAGTAEGVTYLRSQQLANGGWDTSPATEFVTTEALLAVAEAAQTGSSWSTSQALAAVDGFDYQGNPANPDPLSFVDDMADGAVSPSLAGKLILLVAGPLGLDPTAFDPKGDSNPDANLVDAMDPGTGCAGNSASYGFFNETLFAILAKRVACGTTPSNAVAAVRAAQQSDGGWNFTGTPDPQGFDDIDTTSNAIQALIASGAPSTDPDVVGGLAFLARTQASNGTWQFQFPPDPPVSSPESTSRAILAITAAGYDVDSSCWRDTVEPSLAANPYVSPHGALAALQQPGGNWSAGGSDSFSTAQAIQGLERTWLPVTRATAAPCAPAGPPGPGGGAGSAPAPGGSGGGGVPGGADPASPVTARPDFTG